MEIRDVINGSIIIDAEERLVLESREFQRLRHIRQLGFAEFSFPSATHSRYIHSLGAMRTAVLAFDSIFAGPGSRRLPLAQLHPAAFTRFRRVLRLAALLHDVGHGPLSHTTECAMPEVSTLRLPAGPAASPDAKPRKATHEDYTLKIILDSPLTPLLQRAGGPWGFGPLHVASLIEPGIAVTDSFFEETLDGRKIDFRPILQQLISSELDADRMDYLRRDSLHAGVSYGQFDFDWLVGNLTCHVAENDSAHRCYLALKHRALYAFEDFLISRYHMFLMVYFHHRSVVFDEMLRQYLESPDCTYSLPADIERYCDCNDAQLFSDLTRSPNPWARRIIEKQPYRVLIELHSAIPATRTAMTEQKRLLARLQKELTAQDIPYLLATSTGELSKYFRKPGAPIFVRYDNRYSKPSNIPLEQCTDLFQRYSEKREITRLYVSPENYPRCRDRGRAEALPYEDEPFGIDGQASFPFDATAH
ncbi:MAG: HD domain-containing protein [Oligoflexia bacterium]|nr:HD domain-containing protein [Oligoflexia bacterium]